MSKLEKMQKIDQLTKISQSWYLSEKIDAWLFFHQNLRLQKIVKKLYNTKNK